MSKNSRTNRPHLGRPADHGARPAENRVRGIVAAAVLCAIALAWQPSPRGLTAKQHRASAAVTPANRPTALHAAESWHIDYPTHHVQGLCVSDRFFWVSSVDRQKKAGWIYRIDRATRVVVSARQIARGDQFHPGGIQRIDEEIWVPLAEYRPHSTSTLLRLDAMSLEEKESLLLDDHIGALAATGSGTLYAANWDARSLYVLDRRGRLRAKVANPTGVAYQDMEWHDGRLYAAGQAEIEGDRVSVVDVLDTQSWRLTGRYALRGERRTGGSNFAREGFARWGSNFFVLPEDGPDSTVYRFPLDAREKR
ncbi:MAG: DUF6454 family protein [Pirellulales bacterium]